MTQFTRLTLSLSSMFLVGSLISCSPATRNNPIPEDAASTVPAASPTANAIESSASSSEPSDELPSPTDSADTTSDATPTQGGRTIAQGSFDLAPGHYCYFLETDTLTANIRLAFDGDNQVYGDARASVHNEPAAYYTAYTQKFAGTLSGNQANLGITTWIEYDVQESQETWTLTNDTLKTQDDTLPLTDCDVVDQAFQDVNGLEARDLLEGATAIHTERVQFAPGASSATVSNSVIRGERDVYMLGAGGGQQMSLSIDALEDNAAFDVISPSGHILTVEAVEETLFLPHNGDYQVIVGGTRGNATYELTIGIQ